MQVIRNNLIVTEDLAVGQVVTVTITGTFTMGASYRLTMKRVGYLHRSPLFYWSFTPATTAQAVVVLDLRLQSLYDLIKGQDNVEVQFGLTGPNGTIATQTITQPTYLYNSAERPDDTLPLNPSENTYTDDEIDLTVSSLQEQIDNISVGALDDIATNTSHRTSTGNPHSTTPADIGALALSVFTAAGDTLRGTGAGAVEKVAALTPLAEAGAGDWAPILKANSTHTVTRSGIWTDITPSGLEPGEGCSGRITGQFAAGTTGLAPAFDGALDDIGAAVVDFVIYRVGDTYYGACREVV